MHARHRSPGNGYRSASVGMGLGASRVSPESSARGHSFNNSEYRSFNNRNFGRGRGWGQAQPKSFHHPPQPVQRKGDILMEAGRLAAEYLVSKGLIPQSALSRKWQNGPLKNQVGFRLQEDVSQEARTSAHARLGSGASDGYSSRSYGKGRRSGEYNQHSNSSEWGREYERSGSFSDRSKVSPDNEGEDDTLSENLEEQQVAEDTNEKMPNSAQESGEAANMESGAECNNTDEMGSKASTSSSEKEETDKELSKELDNVTDSNIGNEEDANHNINNGADTQIVHNDSGKHGSDLLTLCKFAKVPTKTRSALTCRVPKVDHVLNTEEVKTSDIPGQDGIDKFAATNFASNTAHDSKIHDSEISKEVSVQSAFEVGELNHTIGGVQGKCMTSQSFPDRFILHNSEELSQGVPDFGRSGSVKERGEKRNAEDSDMNDVTKRPREWLPSLIGTVSNPLHLSNLSQNLESSREEIEQPVMVAVDQDSLVDSHEFPKSGTDPCAEYPLEKRLYPSSFKICDLNLMEASDINDKHCNDQILMYPSMTACKTEAAQIDIDLSISNSNLSGEFNSCIGNDKNIEVIDLENDSIEEDNKAFDDSQRREMDFSVTEGFPVHAHNAEDIADAQDNYDGLISEYLFPNCSVAQDINPLQNEIGLHNGEGTLGDDDSIYMSLGEIPLSFIPAWEQQPPNEYGKPF